MGVPLHPPPPPLQGVTSQHCNRLERNGLKFNASNVSGSSTMFTVEVGNQIRSMYIVPGFPRLMFNAEVLPFYQVPESPVDHFAVQNLFNYPLLLSMNDFWGWGRWDASAWEWIVCSRGQFDDIEDWV